MTPRTPQRTMRGLPAVQRGQSPSPRDTGQYRAKDILEESGRLAIQKKEVDEIDSKSRLTRELLESASPRDSQLAPYIQGIIGSYPEPVREDDRMSLRVKDSKGLPANKSRISASISHARAFAQSATFQGELGKEKLEATLLYCAGDLNRLFLLTNAPLPRLGDIDPEIYNQLTARRSIRLSDQPKKRDLYIFLAPAGVVKTLERICTKHPPAGKAQGLALEVHSQPSSGIEDLPAVLPKPAASPFGSPPHKEAAGPVRRDDAKSKLVNTLGIRPEQLRGMKIDKSSQDRLRALLGKEDFKGFEVVLVQPGVEGMRLIMTPSHPASLVGSRMERDAARTSEISAVNLSTYIETVDRRGRKVYYIQLLGEIASLGGSMDDTAQILHENGEAMQSGAAAEPQQDKLRRERHDAVREYVGNFGGGARADSPCGGQWDPTRDECAFGSHIAIIFSSADKHYLITDGDWEDARSKMEAHLYANGDDARLRDTGSSMGQRPVVLSTGEKVTLIIKKVEKIAGYAAPQQPETPEAMPEKSPEERGAIEVEPPEESRRPLLPPMPSTASALQELVSGARMEIPDSYFEDTMEDGHKALVERKIAFLENLPNTLVGVHLEGDAGGEYTKFSAANGSTYGLFRLSRGCDILENLKNMVAAIVFSKGDWAYAIVNADYLPPELKRALLSGGH